MGTKSLVGVFITFASAKEKKKAFKLFSEELESCDAMQSLNDPLKILVCEGEDYNSLISGLNANHIAFNTGSRVNMLNNNSSMKKYFRENVYVAAQQ